MTPASIRNNNPGAMYPGPSAKKFGSTSFETLRSHDGVHKIASFPTGIHGAAAQFDLLHAKYCGLTVQDAITKWCGAYYVSTYLKVLKDRAGVEANSELTQEMMRDPAVAIPLAKAMAWQEAGQEFPLSEQDWVEAHNMAFSGHVAPAWNPRNDVPSPRPETRWATTVEKAKQTTYGLVGTGTVGTAAVTAPNWVPAVPDAYNTWIANAEAWKAFGAKVAGMPAEFQAIGVFGMVSICVGLGLKRILGL